MRVAPLVKPADAVNKPADEVNDSGFEDVHKIGSSISSSAHCWQTFGGFLPASHRWIVRNETRSLLAAFDCDSELSERHFFSLDANVIGQRIRHGDVKTSKII